ncbi:hypothetical protein [Adhaeribacter radiodurans]|uniref:Uncharacterized protein n=1 Tax=Adhaeribacter radiodurans TaxID=2745197 RepID=A0A7L7LDI8_9BACT|nr:hypothetical protein [Adhaeribacter radiodurans]QMU30817.1 hypothetical protein HUW48_23530 [Adhaeribacter radiodurans]
MRYLFIGLLVLCSYRGVCQDKAPELTPKKVLGVSYGYWHQSRQDQLFSNRIYKGSAIPNLGVHYQVRKKKHKHQVEFGGQVYALSNNQPPYSFTDGSDSQVYQTEPSTAFTVNLNYQYATRIVAFKKNQLWLGLSAENRINAAFMNYGLSTAFLYTTLSSLGPNIQVERLLSNKNLLNFQVQIPLVYWASRSPYALNDDEFIQNQQSHQTLATLVNLLGDGKVQTISAIQKVNFRANLQHQLTPKYAVTGAYQIELLRLDQPSSLRSVTNAFLIGLNITL